MPENTHANNNNGLKPPPPQTLHGVILYHPDPDMDDRIRQVRTLRERGYDVDTICQVADRGRASVFTYLRQIKLARDAYIQAFPEDFDGEVAALQQAILRRSELDALLRRELTKLQDDANPSNRVGMFKLVMRNMRESEELSGLLVQRIEHGGEVAVKDQIKGLLDGSPAPVREAYLDALSAVIAAAEHIATPDQPHPE